MKRTVALPEARDPRVSAAAALLSRRAIATPVLGDSLDDAVAMLNQGRVDAVVAGAVHTTAEVVRAALNGVGIRPGVRTLSSSFFMEVREFRGRGPEVLTFADPAVVPSPGPVRLAEIAAEAVRTRRLVVGDEPRVAFLSYATLGSADGRTVEKVRQGLRLFRDACPEVAADGELQADAALVPEVARAKAPGSPVAGRANVLVFPDLNAANISYKLVERLAGATALGPILQGLSAPMVDLSRGASVDDIVHVAAIAVLLAGASGSGASGPGASGLDVPANSGAPASPS